MDCLFWEGLERAFESKHREYIKARSAAHYRVSTRDGKMRRAAIAINVITMIRRCNNSNIAPDKCARRRS